MEIWRFIDSGAGSASENMAMDEAILNSCRRNDSPPTLHFYTWKNPSITLGYLQDLSGSVRQERCLDRGIRVVRRITGGRAVVHHRDLSFSLTFPAKGKVIPSGIRGSYQKIAEGFVEGLKFLGIHASLADGRSLQRRDLKEGRHLAACFLTRTRSEILVSGRKLLGSAQRRIDDWVLQQGTIMINPKRGHWMSLLRYPDGSDPLRIKKMFESGVTSIQEILGRDVDIRSIKEALVTGISKCLGIRFKVQSLSAREKRETVSLAREKYYDLLEWALCSASNQMEHTALEG
ncbi:MAG: biotin/lipoate A/B protein ligase family protein [bacterium]